MRIGKGWAGWGAGCLVFMLMGGAVQAETIVLKDRTRIQGAVRRNLPSYVEVERLGASVLYTWDEIDRIERADGSLVERPAAESLSETERLLQEGKPQPAR